MQRICPRGERIRVRVVHDPDARPRDAGRDRHLFHDVDELLFLGILGVDALLRPGRPKPLLGPGLVGVPRDRHRDQRQRDGEPRKRVVVGLARRLEGVEVVQVVAPEAEPGEEDHEANHQPKGAPAVGFLLLKEVEGRLVRHALGLVERSTWGTARSAWSSISHRSAGWAFAIPATRFVGNWCCLGLYWVAVSVLSWRPNA